jgi:hypothetical protein
MDLYLQHELVVARDNTAKKLYDSSINFEQVTLWHGCMETGAKPWRDGVFIRFNFGPARLPAGGVFYLYP